MKFQVTGTMQIEAEQAGVYTTSRHPDDDGMALVASNPTMEIRVVALRFESDGLRVDAECVFTHQIGTVTKRDSITFYLTPAVMAGAILPAAVLTGMVGATPSVAVVRGRDQRRGTGHREHADRQRNSQAHLMPYKKKKKKRK